MNVQSYTLAAEPWGSKYRYVLDGSQSVPDSLMQVAAKRKTPADFGNRIPLTEPITCMTYRGRQGTQAKTYVRATEYLLILSRALDRSCLDTNFSICKFVLKWMKHKTHLQFSLVSTFCSVQQLEDCPCRW
jgi:hypothetical protein